ncbi:MAG: DUF2786 domain-containing protein [Desulfobacterales bacterium]|nr:DUF2786 domain-containing protein [Desulfobacterales bacterium]
MKSFQEKKIALDEELEKRILYGLACEWNFAINFLATSLRRKLKLPLFSLKDMKRKIGYYSFSRNEICISRYFVKEHCWIDVKEVLLHEMAHQLAFQAFNAYDETPHGSKFQNACYLLKADPRSYGNYKSILQQKELTTEDKILARIHKLLALAESSNPNEAEVAMAKAYELMEKYNIELIEQNKEREYISIVLGTVALKHRLEEYSIANLLRDFYFVHPIWIPSYVVERGKMGKILEINGTIENVQIASYVYDFVNHYMQSQWKEYNKHKKLTKHKMSDFAVGIIKGFVQKLEFQQNVRSNKKWEIVKADDAMMKEYLAYKYPKISSFTRRHSRKDPTILNDGIKVGEKMVISKGISEHKAGEKLLIEQ